MPEVVGTSKGIYGFDPRSVGGCCLWLDGADSNATANIGTNTWKDKSTFGSNATVTGTRPLTVGTLNSLQAIQFPTTAGNTVATATVSLSSATGFSVFFVANMTANGSSGTRFIATNSDSFQVFSGTGTPITLGTYVGANFSAFTLNLTVDTPFLYSGVVTPSSFYEWSNGAPNSVAGATGSMTATTVYIGNDATAAAGNMLSGQMGEVLVYNQYLSSSKRQAIEGYLAWKWGLASSTVHALARPHPFYQLQPLSRSFLPIDIPGCIIWTDASQLASISGSWLNRSPQGTYTIACGGTLNSAGKNNLSTVTLTTVQSWITTPSAVMDTYTMFWLGRENGTTNSRILESDSGYNQLFGYWSGYKHSLYIEGAPNYYNSGSALAFADTNWDLMSHSRTAGGPYTFNWDGTSLYSGASSYANGLRGLAINAYEASGCEIGEIILYNWVLPTYQIQQVEGYLAWKWGTNRNLPSAAGGHPFYNFAPLSPTQMLPTNINNCMLWLDGADSSTISGTSAITAWADKSGNARDTTSVTGTPSTSTSINGVQAILFNGSSSLTGSITGSGGTLTVCIVGTQNAACPLNAGLVCFSSSGVSDSGNAGSVAITNYNSIGSGYVLSTRNSVNSQLANAGTTNSFIYIVVYDGTYVNTYLNGTLVSTANISSGGTFAFTTYVIGNRAGSTTSNPWRGNIGEVIVYSSALVAEQLRTIEGYLSWKWGISLPSTHSYYKFAPSQISPPMAVPSVGVSLASSTLTATWSASPDAVSYTADLYSSSTSGGTYAFVSSQTVTATTAAIALSATNYYKVYVTVNGPVDKSTVTQSTYISYTASSTTWSFTAAYAASGSTGTPLLALNGSLVTNGVSSFNDTITGNPWYFNTTGYGGYTNPVATALTIDGTYKAIKLPGTTYGFLSYGTWDQSTLAYPTANTSTGFSDTHTAIIIYRRYGGNIGSGGEGAGNAVSSGSILYMLGRSSAYNYPTGGVYAGEIITGENGMWTYGFGPYGGTAFQAEIRNVGTTYSATPGWVCHAFSYKRAGTSYYYRVTGSSGSYTVSTPASVYNGNGAYVDGSLYVGMDQRNTYYGGDYGNLLNGAVAFFGMWNSNLSSTQISNFIVSAGPQFGTFV